MSINNSSILMALLVDGIARAIISKSMHDEMAIYVLIFAIGISGGHSSLE